MKFTSVAVVALALCPLATMGCSSQKKAATPDEVPSGAPAMATPKQTEAVKKAADENQGGGLRISDEIMKLCPGIRPPKFGYDSAAVSEGWTEAMQQIAKCMNDGGLKGKGLLLTGHTDPRGDDEYNMALGGRRASAVKTALGEFGVDAGRVDVTSRGEVDAKGTDEDTWSQDRRVDIGLRPGS
jgi:peptidoglycan-associated lipoprotein